MQSRNQKNNVLLIFAIATFSINGLILLLVLFHQTMLQQLSQQLMPQSLVELANGQAITADAEDNLERQPQTIRRFVGETMTFLLTTSPKQPANLVLETSSQLLAPEFRPLFQTQMKQLNKINQLGISNRSKESVLAIARISEPIPLEPGEWKVEMQANQLIFSSSDLLGESIPFNKQIFVRAVPKQTVTLPENSLPWHLAIYRLGEAKLEIYRICDLQAQKCS